MERLTQLELDILKFAGRQRCVRPEHIEHRFEVSRATAYRRPGSLTERGLLASFEGISTGGRVFAATREGLATASLPLRPAEPTTWFLPHDEAMTSVVCELERQHVDCLTEREIVARGRMMRDGRHEFELEEVRNGRRVQHRPDVVCELPDTDSFIAIEVELSPKNVDRWRDILRAFDRRIHVDGFIGVLYVAGPDARGSRIAALANETGLGARFQLRQTSDLDLLGGLVAIVNADAAPTESVEA
ncbi:MAG: hypothetical protein JHC98_06050 [Thermoleophilaceae bacterium]|nr:hypothetical protein [Thermoleophilaceae bacterium]